MSYQFEINKHSSQVLLVRRGKNQKASIVVRPNSGQVMPIFLFLKKKFGKSFVLKCQRFVVRRFFSYVFCFFFLQTSDMQWTYNIKGILPEYNPPRGLSSHPMCGPHPDPRYRPRSVPNFIRDNLKLTTTGVSSPIKGAPIIIKRHPQIIAS